MVLTREPWRGEEEPDLLSTRRPISCKEARKPGEPLAHTPIVPREPCKLWRQPAAKVRHRRSVARARP